MSSATRARVCPKQNCWSAFTGWGTTSTRAKVALGWRGASWAKLSLLMSATTSCFNRGKLVGLLYKPTMKLLPHPPPSTHLYKLGKGKLHDVVKLMANCLEQKGTMRAISRGDYDGLVAANEPPAPEFSPRRVLKNYGDMTTSEFQSHLIKLDTTFRGDKALNTGKRPPNTEFVHERRSSTETAARGKLPWQVAWQPW